MSDKNLPVANSVVVKIAESIESLSHDKGSLRLCEVLLLGDMVEKLTSLT